VQHRFVWRQTMPKGQNSKTEAQMNMLKFFEKNIIEGKSMNQCSKELGLHRSTLHNYKQRDDFRQMAVMHLEDSKLNGVKGTVSKLVGALDATKPIVMTAANGSTSIRQVPDSKTRMEALKEVIKIYGLYAPQKQDTTLAISISSDEELFRQIDEAQRDCCYVDSYVKGEKGFELDNEEQTLGRGNFETRERALLQNGSV